jgi:hypothetical protein
MEQYRKKPVTIEAVQFDGLNPTEIKDFVGKNCEVEIYDNEVTPPIARIIIHTLEGDMEVSKGDFVIKGVKGEFYPCKPDIFEQTYESVEKQDSLALEEAAEEYASNSTGFIDMTAYRAFIAGAKWLSKQGYSFEYVIQYAWGVSDTSTQSKKIDMSFPLPADMFEGDRVVIQIRKK